MEQNPPPGLPANPPDVPARPVVVPIRPARRRPRGRPAPLPDPVAVRQVKVPNTLPPYDGEPVRGRRPTAAAAAGPADRPGPAVRPGPPDRPGPDAASEPGTIGLTDRAIPGPDGWPSHFAQVLAETLAGVRPARQLTQWTTEQTRERIRELGPLLASGQRPRLRRLMASAPATDVLEVTAVVGFGPRVRVLALRLERADPDTARWQCTALESA